MRSVADWLLEYGESHGNSTNKLLHSICVPLIVVSVIGLLWSIPVPAAFSALSPWLNWATVVSALAVVYYLALSVPLAIGAAIAIVVLYAIANELRELQWPLWITSLIIFTGAWIGQFAGHAVEGKRASFFKDVQFLLIGPLWLVAAVYRALRIPY